MEDEVLFLSNVLASINAAKPNNCIAAVGKYRFVVYQNKKILHYLHLFDLLELFGTEGKVKTLFYKSFF